MQDQIIDPFTNIELKPIEVTGNNGEATFIPNLRSLNIGDGGNNVFRADKSGIWLGGSIFGNATFSVSMLGEVTGSLFTVTGGTIRYNKTTFDDVAHTGYWIGALGLHFGESAASYFKYTIGGGIDLVGSNVINPVLTGIQAGSELAIQGWTSTLIFTAVDNNTVSWSAGSNEVIKLLDGTTYTIAAGNTGNMAAVTYIYFDKAFPTVLKYSTTSTDAVGSGKILVAVACNNDDATSKATFQAFGGKGGALWTTENIAANSITANEIAANTIEANNIKTGELIVGTNVGLGTAQDSAGVTTIIGNVIDTGYVNALAITVLGAVTAGSISGITITGGTLQTATSGQRVVIAGSDNTLRFYDTGAQVIGIGTTATYAFDLDLNATTNNGIGINSSVAGIGYRYENSGTTINAVALDILMPGGEIGATNSLPAIRVVYGGTDSIFSGTVEGASAGIQISRSVGSGTANLLTLISNNAAGGTILGIERSGSGAVKGISLLHDTSSNSENVGIEFDLSGGDATKCYAFEFSGSEYIAAATAVSGLTGVIKVLTSDGAGYVAVYSAYT